MNQPPRSAAVFGRSNVKTPASAGLPPSAPAVFSEFTATRRDERKTFKRNPGNPSVALRRFFILHSSFCLAFLLLAARASAHLPAFSMATATIEPDGRYEMDLTFDVVAFALNQTSQATADAAMNELLDGPDPVLAAHLAAAQLRFQSDFAVLADGTAGTLDTNTFPTLADLQRYKESPPTPRLPVMLMASLAGHLPAGARSVSFRFPPAMGSVAMTVMRPTLPPASLVANPGLATDPVPLTASTPTAGAPPILEPSRWHVARQYLGLGFSHIVPEGLDHILFVLGLFLLGNRLKPLLIQVTAFTVAHSITLGLSLYGIFRLPPAIVEPLIALSIAFVAVENICTPKLQPWRPFVVFGFGLIHGLGFAGVLTSFGLVRQQFALALVSFNAGVELGQLFVITLAFLAVGWWRQKPWYRTAIVIPASVLIAATGLFWTVQRLHQAIH